MYRNQHNGRLSIEGFHLFFGGNPDPENRWGHLSALMPCEELEETCSAQFSPTVGAPVKPVSLAFRALFIKQGLGLTDEETVHQIWENAYMQFLLGFTGYSSKAPFDPSMMVHFRMRFSEEHLKWINELVVQLSNAMLVEAVINAVDGDDSDNQVPNADDQLSLDDLVKPAAWPEGKNWGTLSIEDSCTPLPISPIQQTSNC